MAEVTKYHGTKNFNQEGSPAGANFLSKVKIGESYYYLKDMDARAIIDGIYEDYLRSDDKVELIGKIDAEEARALAAEGVLDGKITTLNGLLETLDGKVDTEIQARKDADDALDARIDALETDAVKIASGEKIISKNSSKELQTTLSISIEQIADKESIVLKGIDGAVVASVDATKFVKDGMIESVELTEHDGKKYLKITWNTDAGKQPVEIELTTLIDVYTAGKGLELTGNQFSVKIDETSEQFLSVSVNGVKLSGIQDAINLAAGDALADAKEYTDGLDSAMDARVAEFEVGGTHDVAALETKVDGIDSAYKAADTALGNRIKVYEDNKSGYDDAVAKKHEHANKSELDLIATGDKAKWDAAVSGLAAEIERATAAEAAAIQTANSYTDGKIADEVTARNAAIKEVADDLAEEVTRATGVESGLRTDVDANAAAIEVIEGKEAGWDAKLNTVKINGAFKTVATDATNGKYVDLGNIATDERVSDLEDRVEAAEGKLEVIQGIGEGSISKAKSDAIDAAKEYTDDEIAAVEEEISILSGDFADHTHSVTGTSTFTPSIEKTEKYLGISETPSAEFVKEVTNDAKGLAVAQYVNEVTTTSTTINGVTATVGTGNDSECLILAPQATTFNAVANNGVSKAAAATGELSTDAGLAQVVTSITATNKGTALASVSLTDNGTSGVKVVETVSGKEQTVNVSGTAAKVSE